MHVCVQAQAEMAQYNPTTYLLHTCCIPAAYLLHTYCIPTAYCLRLTAYDLRLTMNTGRRRKRWQLRASTSRASEAASGTASDDVCGRGTLLKCTRAWVVHG